MILAFEHGPLHRIVIVGIDITGPAWLSADREFQLARLQSGLERKDDYETNGNSLEGKAFIFQMPASCPGGDGLCGAGCPHNQYLIELKPQGDVIQRTLTFYCEDGVNTNTGAPNYQPFGPAELAAITALYPPQGLTNDGLRYVARGEFTHQLPADVGGAGAYTHLTNSLGEAGFYVERFRGNDDLAGIPNGDSRRLISWPTC